MKHDETNGSAKAAAEDLLVRLGEDRVMESGRGYTEAVRIWNGAVDHQPAVVVRVRTAADVQAAVATARRHGVPLSVRGGGHDWAGRALRNGGLVVDPVDIGDIRAGACGAAGPPGAPVDEVGSPGRS